jgi:hypothetical protein
MKATSTAVWLAMALSLDASASADAQSRVTVVETYPAGDSIVLGRNQKLYVRLSYATDRAVRIWVRPYLHGREVDAGSSPSNPHAGTGEALGWFFLMHEGDEVDELRVTAGDGTRDGTHVVANYPIRVRSGTREVAESATPEWVAELTRQAELAAKQTSHEPANAARSVGESVLFGSFMLVMLGASLFGFVLPAWGIWRWRGGWRIAASAPAVMMAFVLLRILIGVSVDSTSHNLWPFELLQAGLLSVVVMGVLFAARRFARVRR